MHSNDVQNTENNQILDNAIQKHNSNVKHKSIWDKPDFGPSHALFQLKPNYQYVGPFSQPLLCVTTS